MQPIRLVALAFVSVLSVVALIAVGLSGIRGTLDGSALAILSLILAVWFILGPFWGRISNALSRLRNRNLPTDNPVIAAIVLHLCLAPTFAFLAYQTANSPTWQPWRIERPIFAAFGLKGVLWFWIAMAAVSLASAVFLYRSRNKHTTER